VENINKDNASQKILVEPHRAKVWDSIEYILLAITLAIFSLSLSYILHHFVDVFSPNLIFGKENSIFDVYLSYISSDELLRIATASLIVSYPFFVLIFLNITKKNIQNPLLQDLLLRKIFLYGVLSVSFLGTIGYLIFTIYQTILGNFTNNLVLHTLVTLFIGGIIFSYYFLQTRREKHNYA